MATERLTQEQIDGIKAFAEGVGTDDMNDFMRALKYYRPVIGHEEQPPEPREPWHVWTARNVKNAMDVAGITDGERRNDPAIVERKMLAWLNGAETQEQKDQRMIVLLKFTVGMTEVRTADIDLSETIPQPPEPIHGETKAVELGLPNDLQLTEVEDALAG